VISLTLRMCAKVYLTVLINYCKGGRLRSN